MFGHDFCVFNWLGTFLKTSNIRFFSYLIIKNVSKIILRNALYIYLGGFNKRTIGIKTTSTRSMVKPHPRLSLLPKPI